MTDTDHSSARPPELPADLGAVRTVLAADRTLMAWIRTSLSMLSFGFTIYKFLQGLADNNQIAKTDSPQHVGMFLAAAGTGAMVLGTLSYWGTLRDVARAGKFRLGRSVLAIALLMSLAGVALFWAIAKRLV
ncbi:DUF202 domain-containing protein [Novosphingobium sp. BL-8H]|uniref:YidH family protein n=1 Tax=Novosphingobium sp. BL-8H TaxID=3127640 RepID=UPI003757E60A